ncbi:MAG TPA: DUF3151 family protein [Microthrixaceae bacterium]|nr:DUF3151 family protein [Microthrixaceae bacterium]
MSEVRLIPSGIPETILPDEPAALTEAITAAQQRADDERRDALASVVARAPRSSAAWAALGSAGRDPIERYAAYRVGYHRGLDSLRANGWRGSGYVRWRHPSNRGVLACFAGLMRSADEIGETDEVERLATFLRQLDPEWSDDNR